MLWRRGGKRKKRFQLRLWNLNICMEKVDVKWWLAKMTLVMTSLPLARVASMFVYIRARSRLALIGRNLTAQSTGSDRGILVVEAKFQRRCWGWRMVFASIREHASTAIFLGARAEIKNLLCAQQASSSLESTTRKQRHFLYFTLAAIHMEILFF